jgi:uncharacterized iron-regulated membrane protein
MKLQAYAAQIHKWLALIVGVQVLFWVASGLFFAIFPIEQVRSEHRIAQHDPAPLSALVADVSALLPEAPTKVTYERDAAGDAVAVAEFAERRPILIDLEDWRVASPLTAEAAAQIAQAYTTGGPRYSGDSSVTRRRSRTRGPPVV